MLRNTKTESSLVSIPGPVIEARRDRRVRKRNDEHDHSGQVLQLSNP